MNLLKPNSLPNFKTIPFLLNFVKNVIHNVAIPFFPHPKFFDKIFIKIFFKYKLALITTFLISLTSFAQINHGGTPLSFSKTLGNIPVYTTPLINTQQFIDEDKVTDLYKDIAWRFGIEQFVTLNLSNAGTWSTLANGDRVWRLKIQSPNAKTINFNYGNFNLPIGSIFFVYNKSQVLGSFTHLNNKENSEFSTSLLLGDYAILEYFEPLAVLGLGTIEISSVVHGYRNLYQKLKNFNDAGSCHINAVCDTTNWGNEIRSSVMLLTSGNSRFCSGALINNTLQNGTPYLLTANHCNPTGNNIFMFNYQSPTCSTNTDGLTNQTISGCTIKANDAPSDFFLVELSSVPPANYNVFYAGWSKINTPPTSATGIHYPRLDVKKISHDTDLLIESGYYTTGSNHWQVLDWNTGTTEGGSSGSPLYDQNHRIVGQLHGGDAACGNDAQDYYGKFSYSWNANPSNTKQLKFWLDPTNTGNLTLDGFDPNGANLITDAALLNTSGIEAFICGNSISPMISIRNNGSANLTSLTINYELDGGGINTINWIGNLASYGVDIVALPSISILNGAHIFTVNLSNPNGSTDQNLLNNNASINFSSTENPLFASLTIIADDYGSELNWTVTSNATGNIVHQGGGYPNVTGGSTITENVCLYESCFTFTLTDSGGDGYCCAYGTGSLLLTENTTGDVLAIENSNAFISNSMSFPFCMGNANGINELKLGSFNLFPNPTNGFFTIKRASNISVNIIIYDLLGKVVFESKKESKKEIQLDLTSINQGIYFVSIVSDNRKIVKRLVIN